MTVGGSASPHLAITLTGNSTAYAAGAFTINVGSGGTVLTDLADSNSVAGSLRTKLNLAAITGASSGTTAASSATVNTAAFTESVTYTVGAETDLTAVAAGLQTAIQGAGKLGTSEKVLANYAVTVRAGAGNSSTQTYTVTTDASGNYEVANLPAGNWIVTPAALPNANYEKVYDTDSGLVSADWSVVASVPSTGTVTADFATAMTSAAVAAGAPDILGSTAAAPVTGTGSSAGAGSSTDSTSTAVAKGSLKGNLWVDANRNGVRDAGEKILAGYAFRATTSGNDS